MLFFSKTNFILLLCSLLCLAACSPSKSITITPATIQTGRTIVYRITNNSETIVTRPDGTTETIFKTTITDSEYRAIQSYPNGNTDFEIRILRRQSLENKNGVIKETDTALPVDSADIRSRLMAATIQNPLKMTLSNTGQVSNFSGMNAIWETLEYELKDEKGASEGIKGVKQALGDEAMAEIYQESWRYLPGKPVRRGQKWQKEYLVPVIGAVAKTAYQFKSQTPEGIQLTGTTISKHDPANPGKLEFGPVIIQYFLDGTGSFIATLDPTLFWIQKSEQTATFTGKMAINVPMLATQKIPTQLKITSIVERL